MTVIKKASIVQETKTIEIYRVYKRRWFMLFIFFILYFVGTVQWTQYTIIENIVMEYYGVSSTMVKLTSEAFLMTYLPLIIPASYILNKKGVRYAMIVAVTGHLIGAWLKVFSTKPDGFLIGLLGQTIVAVSQTLVVSMPPKIAGLWFNVDQMSTACTIGFFGSASGSAVSFLFTPIIVQNLDKKQDIEHELLVLFLVVAIASTVVFILTVGFFQEAPPTPPSESQRPVALDQPTNTLQSYWKLLKSGPFVILFCAYGLNIGVFNSINSLLNPIILEHFEEGEQFAGRIGLVIVLTGCLGLIIFGIILDKTKRFKETMVALYIMTLFSLLGFTFAVYSENKMLIYLSAGIYGIFITGYIPVTYETGVELTYPESEFNSTGVLSAGSHTWGGIFVMFFNYILQKTNSFWTNMTMVLLLVIGTGFSLCVRNIRKRQDALQQNKITSDKKIEKF